MRFIIPTLLCLVLSLLARGEFPDWAAAPSWGEADAATAPPSYSDAPEFGEGAGYFTLAGYASIGSYTTVEDVFTPEATMEAIFEEAGVSSMPTGIHAMSPLGLKRERVLRLGLDFMTDEDYRQELVELLIEIRQAQERRKRLRGGRGRP